jgi:hypothetical protein
MKAIPSVCLVKEWPYLWTEREYIIGGATMHLFMILAADRWLGETPS